MRKGSCALSSFHTPSHSCCNLCTTTIGTPNSMLQKDGVSQLRGAVVEQQPYAVHSHLKLMQLTQLNAM